VPISAGRRIDRSNARSIFYRRFEMGIGYLAISGNCHYRN